jgi:hypothetical protein
MRALWRRDCTKTPLESPSPAYTFPLPEYGLFRIPDEFTDSVPKATLLLQTARG